MFLVLSETLACKEICPVMSCFWSSDHPCGIDREGVDTLTTQMEKQSRKRLVELLKVM